MAAAARKTQKINPSDYITNMRRVRFWLPRTAQWLRKVSGLVNGATFNLGMWGKVCSVFEPAPSNPQEASSCGFEGCALGWAPLDPKHRKAGLTLNGVRDSTYLIVRFNGQSGYGAACDFYGITEQVAVVIFGRADTDWRNGKIRESANRNLVRQHDPIAAAERIERFCNDMGIALLPDDDSTST